MQIEARAGRCIRYLVPASRVFLAGATALLAAAVGVLAIAEEGPRPLPPAPQVTGGGMSIWRSGKVCGVNCLYLMLRLGGVAVDYGDLLEELLPDNSETSLTSMMRSARRHGLDCAMGKTDPEGLKAVSKPVVAHGESFERSDSDVGHFVLVLKTTDEGVSYVDGTTALMQSRSWRDFEREWSGYILYRDGGAGMSRAMTWASVALNLALGFALGLVLDRFVLRRLLAPKGGTRHGAAAIGAGPPAHEVPMPSRASSAVAVACLLAAAPMQTAIAADPPVPTLEQISSAYQARRDAMQSGAVYYETRGTALVDEKFLSEVYRVVNMPHTDTVSVVKGPKVYSKTVSKMKAGPPPGIAGKPEKSAAGADGLTTMERILVFDGKVLREKSPVERSMDSKSFPSYFVLKIEQTNLPYFPQSYWENIGQGIRDPGMPTQGRDANAHRIPDMFKEASFAVSPALEDVGGTRCVAVEAPGYQKLWLDPEKGLVARKREFYRDGQPFLTMEFDDFAQVKDLWFPRLIHRYPLGTADMPQAYRGKRLMDITDRVTKLEVNEPGHEEFFELKPPAGALVLDTTLEPLDRSGKPVVARSGETKGVGYMQPANEADLQKVIQEARTGAARPVSPEEEGRGRWGRFLAWAVIIGVAGALVWSNIRARRAPSIDTQK